MSKQEGTMTMQERKTEYDWLQGKVDDETAAWLLARKEEALKIDPETAEVFGHQGYVIDPYGVCDLSDEEKCIGWNHFVRNPGSDIWVWDGDLPEAVDARLQELRV